MAVADVLPIEPEDIPLILRDVRQADIDEIVEGLGVSLELELLEGINDSLNARKIVVDGHIVAVFGDAVHSVLGSIGVPWLISTTHVERHARAFLKVCKPEVQGMLTRHRHLINYVDARNTSAIRWLKWLGFDFSDEAIPYGPKGLPFFCFRLERDHD